jgi:cobalt-zinc-cadmium efflux system membrane fusion protein
VVARAINPGMEIQGLYTGGAVAGLFTVGELDSVWVVADVYERDIGRVKVGAPARIAVVAYPGRTFQGRADWLSPALDPATRTAKLRCRVPNPDHALKPEMFATVSIAAEPRRALAVARAAVLRLGDQTVVFVEGGRGPDDTRRFDRRPVEVTDPGGKFLPIARGLSAGERVVVSGAILLAGML